ncbi:hypothetical protein [Streptomyces sp. B6B3]|uniref:hypothetical protein n=1 Tax=Streptomyces sp. B6B3 TaxID=3153570 RepID=UPI00325EF829
MKRIARVGTLSVSVLLVAVAMSPSATGFGNGDGDSRDNVGGHEDGVLTAEASTEVVISGDTGGGGAGDGSGSLSPIDTGWEPPVCWYEPYMTAEQFRDAVENLDSHAQRALNISSPPVAFTDIYRDNNLNGWAVNFESVYGEQSYENYNLDAEEDGLWWHGVINPNREDEFRMGTDCPEPIFWADSVDEPALEESITDEVLAEYAYDEIAIPETEIEINPEGDQYVNIPMWIWLDAGEFEPRTVRAELPINGLWAETTAEPVAMTLDPGTEDAVVYPESGECEIDANGRIGEPYERGRAEEDPPCGVEYLRSTHEAGSYELTASLTWEVYWTGSQTEGRNPLPSGTFETTHTIVVDENQTIVR